MKPLRLIAPSLLAAIAALAAANAVYVVEQGQQAVLLRLGQPVGAINAGPASAAAGLHLKWPFVDRVVLLDRRVLALQAPPSTSSVSPVQADMRYLIRDPLRFYRTLGDGRLGGRKLAQMLQYSLDRTLAGPQGWPGARPALDGALRADLRRQVASGAMGVDILDAHLEDASPSPATTEALASRMQAAETQQVGQIKAQGEQHRRDLLAQADRDAAGVRDEGERQALVVRGDGDAQRAAILGDAYGKDPAFAAFFRRIEAYDQALNPDTTTLVLSPDTGFLSLFGQGPGPAPKPPR